MLPTLLALVCGCSDDIVVADPEIVDLVAFGSSTCAIDSRGGLRCWGAGGDGLLGYAESQDIGDDEDWCAPGLVDVGHPVRSIHVLGGKCTIDNDGEARCWGPGVFGFPFTTPDQLPHEGIVVRGPAPLVQLRQGSNHACALFDTGTVKCWGAGIDLPYGDAVDRGIGQDPNDVLAQLPDVPLGGEATFIEVGSSAHGSQTCALLRSGGVRCWGSDTTLGYGTDEIIGDDETPEQVGDVPLGGAAIGLASAGTNWCALLEDRTLRCWGRDAPYGLLGYGDIFSSTDHVGDDETPMDMGPVSVGEAVENVFMGYLWTCALLDAGRVRCWGDGLPGQLGYGELVSRLYEPPDEDVELGGAVQDLTLGIHHACALLESGRVRCWGVNDRGQLGLGDPDFEWTSTVPAEVDLLPECHESR
jgi:alpha-tubulin suppressor-like RCC1 family protein